LTCVEDGGAGVGEELVGLRKASTLGNIPEPMPAPAALSIAFYTRAMDNLAALRKSYELAELDESASADDPFRQFGTWLEQAIAAGAQEYIMKPFDEVILRGKLEQVGLL